MYVLIFNKLAPYAKELTNQFAAYDYPYAPTFCYCINIDSETLCAFKLRFNIKKAPQPPPADNVYAIVMDKI